MSDKKINRKEFVEKHGATCNNWRQSWSFINEEKKTIIFTAWDDRTEGNRALVFSEDWEFRGGNKRPAYKQSREHIRLIEEEGFKLMIFLAYNTNKNKDEPRKIGGFDQELSERVLKPVLKRDGNDQYMEWYAEEIDSGLDEIDSGPDVDTTIPEEIDSIAARAEGISKTISVNKYERNKEARQKCIDHHGYSCAACEFNFEKFYGPVGEKFIHIHHVTPIDKIDGEYEINPVQDLIPVCPNCHSIIHRDRAKPPIEVEELKNLLKNQRERYNPRFSKLAEELKNLLKNQREHYNPRFSKLAEELKNLLKNQRERYNPRFSKLAEELKNLLKNQREHYNPRFSKLAEELKNLLKNQR